MYGPYPWLYAFQQRLFTGRTCNELLPKMKNATGMHIASAGSKKMTTLTKLAISCNDINSKIAA